MSYRDAALLALIAACAAMSVIATKLLRQQQPALPVGYSAFEITTAEQPFLAPVTVLVRHTDIHRLTVMGAEVRLVAPSNPLMP